MEQKVPGVYILKERKSEDQIMKIDSYNIAGFVGIAERGPFHTPVKVRNMNDFNKIFGGYIDYGYLAYTVYGFFKSGGNECYVVRTAHTDDEDLKNSASPAEMTIQDGRFGTSMTIKANSCGSWGNSILIRLWHTVVFTEKLSGFNLEEKAIFLHSDHINQLLPGDDIKLICGTLQYICSITAIDYNSHKINIHWIPQEITVDTTYITMPQFNLSINYKSQNEEYIGISSNPARDNFYGTTINVRSKVINIENRGSSLPCEVFFKNLSNGKDGLRGLTPGDFIGYYKSPGEYRALGAFERIKEVALIAIPDIYALMDFTHGTHEEKAQKILAVQLAMLEHCEKLGNRYALLDPPFFTNKKEIIEYTEKIDSAYGSLYYPLIYSNDPASSSLHMVLLPPSGHIAGIYAKTDREKGIYHPPANFCIEGAVGLSDEITNSDIDILYDKKINCLKYIPGKGIKIWGAKTLSSNQELRYINVRRTLNAIKDSLKYYTAWAVFEHNDEKLRKQLVRKVTSFMIDLWKKGFFAGVNPEDGFFVRCDNEINSIKDINDGIINIEVGIAIVRPAEYFIINLKAEKDKNAVS